MTLDTRLREAAADTRDKIAGLAQPAVSRHRRAAWGWAAVAFVAVLAVVGVGPRLMSGAPPVGTELTTTTDPEDAPMVVERGVFGPEPRFDTASLGWEVELGPIDEDDLSWLATQVEAAVNTGLVEPGSVGGDIAVVQAAGTLPSGFIVARLIGPEPESCIAIVAPSGGLSCSRGSTARPATIRARSPSGEGTMAWGPVPAGTSVVQITLDDVSFWMRPVGGVAAFDVGLGGEQSGSFLLRAYSETGEIIFMSGISAPPIASTSTTPASTTTLGTATLGDPEFVGVWPYRTTNEVLAAAVAGVEVDEAELAARFIEDVVGWTEFELAKVYDGTDQMGFDYTGSRGEFRVGTRIVAWSPAGNGVVAVSDASSLDRFVEWGPGVDVSEGDNGWSVTVTAAPISELVALPDVSGPLAQVSYGDWESDLVEIGPDGAVITLPAEPTVPGVLSIWYLDAGGAIAGFSIRTLPPGPLVAG